MEILFTYLINFYLLIYYLLELTINLFPFRKLGFEGFLISSSSWKISVFLGLFFFEEIKSRLHHGSKVRWFSLRFAVKLFSFFFPSMHQIQVLPFPFIWSIYLYYFLALRQYLRKYQRVSWWEYVSTNSINSSMQVLPLEF